MMDFLSFDKDNMADTLDEIIIMLSNVRTMPQRNFKDPFAKPIPDKSSAPKYWQATVDLMKEQGLVKGKNHKTTPPKAHTGGIVSKTQTYLLKKGEMIVPVKQVAAVKKAMNKSHLKPINKKV
jgi:hypothetical protein